MNQIKYFNLYISTWNFSLACTCGHLQRDKCVIVNFIQPALVGLIIMKKGPHYFFTLFYEMGVLDCI